MEEGHPEWMQEGARQLATDAEALLRRHEQEDHEGETCMAERAGMVAFMAHRLGVRTDGALRFMLVALEEYEEQHVDPLAEVLGRMLNFDSEAHDGRWN